MKVLIVICGLIGLSCIQPKPPMEDFVIRMTPDSIMIVNDTLFRYYSYTIGEQIVSKCHVFDAGCDELTVTIKR